MIRQKLIGIDVGGTFTDVFVFDQHTGETSVHKVASTRGHEADGFFLGISAGVEDVGSIAALVHGTTVGTNALLERKGCLLYTSPSPRDLSTSRMPSSA